MRGRGGHVLTAGFPLADAFARHLETEPTLRRVKGGRYGEMALTGKPRSDASRANLLPACPSFYGYAVRARAAETDPFEAVLRPLVDPDESPTEGLTEDEMAKLIVTATAWSARTEALVKLLYLMWPRVDEVLARDADQLGYDRGHHDLPLRVKGGKIRPKPVVPLALDALQGSSTAAPPVLCSRQGPGRGCASRRCGSCCAASRPRPACRRPPPSSRTSFGTASSPTPSTSACRSRTRSTTRPPVPPSATTDAADATRPTRVGAVSRASGIAHGNSMGVRPHLTGRTAGREGVQWSSSVWGSQAHALIVPAVAS